MNAQELFARVTAQVMADLEAGVKPWECPWQREQRGPVFPRNLKTGRDYRGLNVPILWQAAQVQGFSTNLWLTFKQAKALGGNVRQGSKATHAALYKPVEVRDREKEEGATRTVNMLRVFALFNLDQTDGLAHLLEEEKDPVFRPVPAAEAILEASGARIAESGTRAFYDRKADRIQLPERRRFLEHEDFYATALHELTHWTGAEHRLNRSFGERFGDDAYAFEELVAEMGSAFLVARIGLRGEMQHASYVDNWLEILRRDAKAFAHAAALAQQAYDFVIAACLEATRAEAGEGAAGTLGQEAAAAPAG